MRTHLLLLASLLMGTGCLTAPLTAEDVFPHAPFANAELEALTHNWTTPGRLLQRTPDYEVWVRELKNDDFLLALVNRSKVPQEVHVPLASLGAGEMLLAHNCLKQKDEGVAFGEYYATLPPHAIEWVRLGVVPCRKCL